MIVNFSSIQHLNVTIQCWVCRKEFTANMRHCTLSELTPTVKVWCEEHGWTEDHIDWGDEINKAIAVAKKKQVKLEGYDQNRLP